MKGINTSNVTPVVVDELGFEKKEAPIKAAKFKNFKVTKLKKKNAGVIKKKLVKAKSSKTINRPLTARKCTKSRIVNRNIKVKSVSTQTLDTGNLIKDTNMTSIDLIKPKNNNPTKQFGVWSNVLESVKQQDNQMKIVDELFGGRYPGDDHIEEAKQQIQKKLDSPSSKLSLLMNSLYNEWRKSNPQNIEKLKSEANDKLKTIWMRMSKSKNDTYKLQMVVEGLHLQTKGGHPPSPELTNFVNNSKTITERFRDGFVYDGTNQNKKGESEQLGINVPSKKKVIAVETAFKYESESNDKHDVKLIRTSKKHPDISLSNLGEDKVRVLGEMVDTNHKEMNDTVVFSNGVYSFHGSSIAMDKRDSTLQEHLQIQPGDKDSHFSSRLKAYINDHVNVQKKPLEDLTIAGDLNLYLFEDNTVTGERELKPGVQEVLDEMHLALIVPSGLVTRGRPVSDQLHKNLETQSVEGERDTMVILVPLTEKNQEEVLGLGSDAKLLQDVFLPTKNTKGELVNPKKIIHKLDYVRKQFSTDPKDRVMTDHAILTSPNVILGNMADCFGVSTPAKSLQKTPQKQEIWGANEVSPEEYKKILGASAEILSKTIADCIK